MPKLTQEITTLCQKAKQASLALANLTTEEKNHALLSMAEALSKNSEAILNINQQEVINSTNRESAFLDRLTLTTNRINSMIEGLKKIASLPEPVGKIVASSTRPNGLIINRITIPLGVIAIIYEARPNVTADAAALCLKSGNATILRGGSECALTNQAIVDCLQTALFDLGIDKHAIQYIPTQERSAINILLSMEQYIDVVIPRGGKSLIQYLMQHSRIPLLKHLEGNCHSYIHSDADLPMALAIIKNAKLRRTGICGATETLLIDKAIANDFLPSIINMLIAENCEIRGDKIVQNIDARVIAASEEDWKTEYLAAILAIKVVDNIEAAITHINCYSSSHTEAIITNNLLAAKKFLHEVNSAIVMHNCSTQFADGGEFGMGAEIGIATGKLHARGPVGIEQLTTFKYQVNGCGQIRPL